MIKNKNTVKFIFIILTITLIISIGVNSVSEKNMSGSEKFVGNILSPINKAFYSIGNILSTAYGSIINIYKIREENKQLNDIVARLKEDNKRLKVIVDNSEELKVEYTLVKNIKYDYVKSRVISRDSINWIQRFVIDKGEKDGLKIDDIVIKAVKDNEGIVQVGLVGKIIGVGNNWSKVMTMSDSNSKISFKIQRNGLSGIVYGKMEENIEGYLFNQSDDINTGDEIVTSGLGEIYLPDIYIGKVYKVEKTDDLLTEKIHIEPEVDLTKIFEVYVIKVNRQ